MMDKIEFIEKCLKYFGWKYLYTSTVTDEIYIERYGQKLIFDPFKNIKDAFFLVDELIKTNYEFYLFYKQPNQINSSFRRVEWIAEIRRDGVIVTFDMASKKEDAICGAIKNALVCLGGW